MFEDYLSKACMLIKIIGRLLSGRQSDSVEIENMLSILCAFQNVFNPESIPTQANTPTGWQ
jgi:hypothetical protein